MRKVSVLIIILFWMFSLFLIQGCTIDKPFVYSGDDLKKIDFIKVVRHETPAFRLDTPVRTRTESSIWSNWSGYY